MEKNAYLFIRVNSFPFQMIIIGENLEFIINVT